MYQTYREPGCKHLSWSESPPLFHTTSGLYLVSLTSPDLAVPWEAGPGPPLDHPPAAPEVRGRAPGDHPPAGSEVRVEQSLSSRLVFGTTVLDLARSCSPSWAQTEAEHVSDVCLCYDVWSQTQTLSWPPRWVCEDPEVGVASEMVAGLQPLGRPRYHAGNGGQENEIFGN